MKINHPYTITFLGQTGFGKSSLINALFGTNFNTDPLVSCTKELYSVTTFDNNGDLITVYDTPGIGEFSSNSAYQKFYEYAVNKSDCIVLTVSLDRTDANAQDLLETLKPFVKNDKVKFIIALNRIDSSGVRGSDINYISWDEESNEPSPDAQKRINQRLETIHENFNNVFLKFAIVPVCANRNFGIEKLYKTITEDE